MSDTALGSITRQAHVHVTNNPCNVAKHGWLRLVNEIVKWTPADSLFQAIFARKVTLDIHLESAAHHDALT